MLEGFFSQDNTLSLLCLLLDSRHGLTKTDLEILPLLDLLDCPIFIVLTKSDKNSNNVNQKNVSQLKRDLAEHLLTPSIFLTSTQNKTGLDKLHKAIIDTIGSLD